MAVPSGGSGPRITLDGPRSIATDQETYTVSGTVVGGAAQRVLVGVSGRLADVTGDVGSFSVPVALAPGLNEVRVIAVDAQGREAEERVRVQYTPRRLPGITISAPADGYRLGPDDPPVVVVEGRVEDVRTGVVSLVINERRVRVPVVDHRFRYVVPVLESAVRLVAEGTTGDPPGQSQTITVYGSPSPTPALVLVLDSQPTTSSPPEVAAMWRSSSIRVDVPAYAVALAAVTAGAAMPSAVYYNRNLRPGVYTLALRPGFASGSVPTAGTLYIARDGQLLIRPLRRLAADGARRVIARLLMPFGVLWEQDDWFTGQSQGADTVTKFRFPEGVSWMERKVDLAR